MNDKRQTLVDKIEGNNEHFKKSSNIDFDFASFKERYQSEGHGRVGINLSEKWDGKQCKKSIRMFKKDLFSKFLRSPLTQLPERHINVNNMTGNDPSKRYTIADLLGPEYASVTPLTLAKLESLAEAGGQVELSSD